MSVCKEARTRLWLWVPRGSMNERRYMSLHVALHDGLKYHLCDICFFVFTNWIFNLHHTKLGWKQRNFRYNGWPPQGITPVTTNPPRRCCHRDNAGDNARIRGAARRRPEGDTPAARRRRNFWNGMENDGKWRKLKIMYKAYVLCINISAMYNTACNNSYCCDRKCKYTQYTTVYTRPIIYMSIDMGSEDGLVYDAIYIEYTMISCAKCVIFKVMYNTK